MSRVSPWEISAIDSWPQKVSTIPVFRMQLSLSFRIDVLAKTAIFARFRANPGCSSVHVQTLPVLGSWSWRAFFDVRCVLCHVIEILSIGFEMMWILNWWHSSCCLLFIFTPLCTRLLQVLYSRVLYRYFLHQSIHQRHWRLKANTFRIACTWMSSFGIC